MGTARITKPEIKRAIEAAKECGVKRGAIECNGLRLEYDFRDEQPESDDNIWDKEIGTNSTK